MGPARHPAVVAVGLDAVDAARVAGRVREGVVVVGVDAQDRLVHTHEQRRLLEVAGGEEEKEVKEKKMS